MTRLHSNVCNNGYIDSARALLENGASLESKDHHGKTAFHLAIKHENTKFIKLALEIQSSSFVPSTTHWT